MTNERKIQLGSSVDPTGAKDGLKQIEQAGVQTATALGKSAAEAGKAIDGIGDGGEKAARKLQASERSIIGSIQRATAAAQAGERGTAAFYESLARSRGVSSDVLRPYLDQLRAAEQASRAAAAGVGQIGVSAAQTAAALRGVPAQFTDIVSSIASGQQPLTVFLQQGGQLKDMFGGAGAAARALGGYVLGLVNPFTLAAAAAGALGLAYKFGSDEASAYSRSIVLSGNVAGVTAGQLEAMARGVAALGAGTQGRAAEILAQIAGSADIGAGNMQRFTAAALAFEQVGGTAAEDTAKAFQSLADKPLAAALKLNETTGFLTQRTYDQIRALEEQGRTTEAARVAQEAYAGAIESRTPQLVASLGSIERAWMRIKGVSKKAVDVVLGIGRADTAQSLLEKAPAALERARTDPTGSRFRDLYGNEVAGRAAAVKAIQEQVEYLRKQVRLEQRGAESAAARQAAVKASAQWDSETNKYLDRRQQMAREIAQAEQIGLAAGKSRAEVETLIANIRGKYAEKGGKAPSQQFKAEEEAARVYMKALESLAGIQSQAAASGEALSKSQAKLRDVQADPAWATYSRQQQEQIIMQAAAAQAAEDQAAAVKAGAKIAAEAARDYEQYLKTLNSGGDAVIRQAQALQDDAAAAALAADGRMTLKQAIEDVVIARLREQQIAAMGNEDAVLAIQREIDARTKLRDLLGEAGSREAAAASAKEWARAAEKIGDSITDALMRGFESGKGFARTLRDTVVNMFKSMVLRPIISAVVSPVAGALTGALGFASGAAAAGAGGAGVGAAAGLTGLAAGMGAFGAGVSSGLTAWGAGGSVTGLLGSGSALFAGGVANGLGVIAGALGPIALGVAALTSILGRFDKSGTPHVGAQAMYSAAGGLQTATADPSLGFWMSPGYVDSGVQTAVTGFAQSITSILDKAATTFGKQAGFSVATGFADDSSSDGAFGSLMIQRGGQSLLNWNDNRQSRWAPRIFADGEAGAKEYAAELARSVRTTLDQIGLPSWASGILQSLGDAPGLDQLQQAVDQIAQMRTVFSQLGSSLGITESQVVALAQTFGGVDALASSLGSYMSALYSESDRLKMAQESLSASFAQLGQSVPANAAAYRALVEAQDLNTEAGRAAYTSLVKLAPAFAEVTAAADQAAAQQAELAQRRAAEGYGLETRLLQLQGDALALRARELETLDPANRALQERIYALEDAQAAEEAAAVAAQERAQKADQIASQADSLNVRLLQILGDVTGLRARELSALDPTNRALQERIYALEDAKAAEEAAAAAAQQQAVIAQQVAAQGESLMTRLLQMQGDTAELRARELAALDPANRALQQRLYALEDAQTAADAATRLGDAWRGVADTIGDEIERITGLNRSQTRSLAEVQAEFVTATAQARAGDKAAADRLPVLSRTLLELAQNSATSAAEVTAVRASVLDSLATTADIVRTASTATEAAAKARLSGLLGAAGSATTAPDAAMAEMFRNLLSSLLADRAGATTAPGFAAGGWHAGGLRMVGERGPELEATGPARIWSADQTSRMLSGGFDQAALVAELRALRSEVSDLRAEARATAVNTAVMTKLQKRWDADGLLTTTA